MTLSLGQCATLACLLEVTAPKPGNVHRAADFSDTTFSDFVASAVAIGPVFEDASRRRVGRTVLEAVQATRQVTSVNTNLGLILLLAPLAAGAAHRSLAAGVERVLANLQPDDARDVFEAIRLAGPGGIAPRDQPVPQHDVAESPPSDLREAMRCAADWDLVARQYAFGFREVLDQVLPWLIENEGHRLTDRIIYTHVRTMSMHPDSLIARKCGRDVAQEAAARAGAALAAGPVGSENYERAIADLDFWLRSDGNRRNPGTTADLIGAALFVAIRQGLVRPPYH